MMNSFSGLCAKVFSAALHLNAYSYRRHTLGAFMKAFNKCYSRAMKKHLFEPALNLQPHFLGRLLTFLMCSDKRVTILTSSGFYTDPIHAVCLKMSQEKR